jgi:glycosyltransferase involved in cell wall biosynthesis
MRIAQVATLSAPVCEQSGGSVEALVWLLAREFTRLGHQVTVFAVAGSETAGELVATLPGPYATREAPEDWHLCEWINLCQAVEQSHRFDLLHTHAYLWGLPLEPLSRAPLLHTLHIVPDDDAARLWRARPQAAVTAISRSQWSAFPQLQPIAVVPHGVDPARFTLCAEPKDYVCYLGRFVSGKGPLHAIEAARATGVRLLLAGPENAYFREKVKPLVDGRQVEYVGYVSGPDRDRLLGGARALLYPIQYPEAFGLVLVEAMLCGTPVAALGLGAVPEIVENGVNGFYVSEIKGLVGALHQCFALDRSRVRAEAARRFSVEGMAQGYLRVYERVLNRE